MKKTKVVLLEIEGSYLWTHRLPLARTLRDAGCHVIVATATRDRQKQIEAEGFSYYPLQMQRKMRTIRNEVLSIVNLASFYYLTRPDLIHQIRMKPILYGSIAAKVAGVPAIINAVTGLGYVFTPGGGWKKQILRKAVEWSYRFCFRGNSIKVIFQNEDDIDLFIQERLLRPSQAILIAGSGVDTAHFTPAPEPKGEPIVILASRMLWDKGIGEVIEAARILKQRGIPGKFVFAGDSDSVNPASIPEKQLNVWQQEGIIKWLGHQTDMVSLLQKSHIACLPSSYREGIPMSLLEAASCAKPIVTTDAPGCREVVRDGWNGFLVPIKDPVALAKALQKLLIDPELRMTMGQRGRELVLQRFSKEIIVEQTLAVYKELLGDKWSQ